MYDWKKERFLLTSCVLYKPNIRDVEPPSLLNRIGGVMVSVLASSTVDRGFEPRSGQTKDY
jgi:hypothetical protein